MRYLIRSNLDNKTPLISGVLDFKFRIYLNFQPNILIQKLAIQLYEC